MFIRDSTVITTKHHIMTKVGSDDSAIKAWIVFLNYLLNEYSDIGAMWLMCLERWKCVWISATVGLFLTASVFWVPHYQPKTSSLDLALIQTARVCVAVLCVCMCVCVCERQCKYCPAAQPL